MGPLELGMVSAGVLLLLSVAAGQIGSRFGIPILVVFIVIGMLAGSDGPGGIHYEDYAQAQTIGVLALAFILFHGGMDTQWRQIRPVLKAGLSLAILGTLLTAAIVATVAYQFFGFGLMEAMLLGAIVSSTDAAAVFSLFEARALKVRQDVASMLELESGTNDPIAVFMTGALIAFVTTQRVDPGMFAIQFLWQMAGGVLFGYAIGRGAVAMVNRSNLRIRALYQVVSVAVVLLAYGVPQLAMANGFMSVYVAGLVFGNAEFAARKGLGRFHEGIAWLMQIVMFLILGLLVFPSQLPGVWAEGLIIAFVLALLARPIGVMISLAFANIGLGAKGFIAFTGMRGAVPIILATYPLLANIPEAGRIFNIVFFVVLVSSLVQGALVGWAAQRTGVAEAS